MVVSRSQTRVDLPNLPTLLKLELLQEVIGCETYVLTSSWIDTIKFLLLKYQIVTAETSRKRLHPAKNFSREIVYTNVSDHGCFNVSACLRKGL